ncbi:MAG: hypothetical protein M1821_005716 [Bathelium mastoideum]|nr:MAG: hypothetical protein M1821_005716 [Bathelium mastoideum]
MRQGLNDSVLRSFEPIILAKAAIFVEKIASAPTGKLSPWTLPVNVAADCRYLMFDLMTELCIGRCFHLQVDSEYRYMVDGLAPLHKLNSALVQSTDLASYHLDKFLFPKALWCGWKFLTVAREFTETRSESSSELDTNLLSRIASHTDCWKGVSPSQVELLSECKFLMVTGGGSPASALAALLFYLSRSTACYKTVVEEVRGAFSKATEIRSGPQMSSCRYLRACVMETLRISPPVGAALWREVEKEEMLIDGHSIPRGIDVGVGIYSIHHNGVYFEDPDFFHPERFLDAQDPVQSALAHKAMSPFSSGSRACMGYHLALMELTDIAAFVLWHLDFRKAAGLRTNIGGGAEGLALRANAEEFQQEDHINSFFDGPCLEFTKRNAHF